MYQSRILIHLLWCCEQDKHTLNNITDKARNHLLETAKKRQIKVLSLAVLTNHVHCIVEMNSVQSVSDIVQVLKGACSLWINAQQLLPYRFKWEDGYYAFSLGYSQLTEFKNYITKQNELHTEISLKHELDQLHKKYHLA